MIEDSNQRRSTVWLFEGSALKYQGAVSPSV